MVFKCAFVLLLLASSSFAQTKRSSKKSTLQMAKATAEAEVKRLEKTVADRASDPSLSPCDYYETKVQLKYNQWFLEPAHYEALEKMAADLDASIEAINAKLASLENERVNVLIREGQKSQTTEVPVAFKELLSFFKLYDQRMTACKKEEKPALVEMMEGEPETNPMHIVLSQVRAAGGMMSVNLNASLQEQLVNYDLLMTPREFGYDLELQVRMKLNGVNQSRRFSFLSGPLSSGRLELSEEDKWEILSKGKVDGMPVDGLFRYHQLQEQFKGKCDLSTVPLARYGVPYVKYGEIPGIHKRLQKQNYQWIRDTSEMEFVTIEPGTFQMGSPSTERGRFNDETLHTVTLTQGFEMQTTEITQAQWYEVMKTNPSLFRKDWECETWNGQVGGGICFNLPVSYVSWNDVQTFIQKMNERNDGYLYRLPTEAEWEYAARGGTYTAYYTGDDEAALYKRAWYKYNSNKKTHEVASHGRDSCNAYGLYDVYGNVREWVQDWYGEYGSTSVTDPTGPVSPLNSYSGHVARGGAYDDDTVAMRSATRSSGYGAIGARLVRVPRN